VKSSRALSRKNLNFSKILAVFSDTLFAGTILAGIVCAAMGADTTMFAYAVTAAGTVAGISHTFYYTKAKAENLSKQRVRYVLMKLLLQDRLSGEDYTEICAEIDSIDSAIWAKIDGMTQEAIDGEQSVQNDMTGGTPYV